MTGIEIAVGCMFAWAVRKARRVAGRADQEVDRTLDAAMDDLHDLVSRKLSEEPALRRLTEEAEAGRDQPSDRTQQRVQLALEDAVEQDPGFAEALEHAVGTLQSVLRTAGGPSVGDGAVVVEGNVDIRADHGSVAAWRMGTVNLGNPPQPGTPQG
ncbi:hypothetical protein [Actinacidiphila acididurans]|uniref:Chromosome partitioning protein n=1 Tax=Actinacidiphila acididurans TaxID=2784346 RepID=A0ABS2U3W1_9ACTN|nr:hypothetical protein [Actinacidiphila acididurans]MBM9510304.1 hypothetical protein [Actinacidiphila acididurans]